MQNMLNLLNKINTIVAYLPIKNSILLCEKYKNVYKLLQ